jgi:DNA (cytosine-5)-methyltransferase 1
MAGVGGVTLRMIDTFSGIGGFSLAARWLGGIETVQFVEQEPYCQRILRKHWPTVPIHDDICTFSPAPRSADIICGGFPCQDLSIAGQRRGIGPDTRSGLFYQLLRIIRVVRPQFVVMENVAAILDGHLGAVVGALATAGYDCEWACVSAADLGAWHVRDRWWAVAYPECYRIQGHLPDAISWQRGLTDVSFSGRVESLLNGPPSGSPRFRGDPDGVPGWVDRLKALGNAVVPQVAMVPLARVLELDQQLNG